jgi:hypothetical protein
MFNIDTGEIRSQLLALLSELDEFKRAWRALGIVAVRVKIVVACLMQRAEFYEGSRSLP